tara:strand:- start:1471 stop:2343 length:873 start_codon:yes stop_codon:yes gene_type:complete
LELTEKRNYQKRRISGNLLSLFFINTIALFSLSFMGFLYLKTSTIENYFKENILVNIYLKNSSKEIEYNQLMKFLNLSDQVKEINFVSKEDAANEFSKEIGEEFVGFIGYNPLLDLVSVKLYGDIIDVFNIESFITSLKSFSFIEEIEYDKPLVEILNNNFKKIGLWIILLCIVFFVASFILISNSIRISIYSKREVIKTMQLVGATGKFIRKPFILTHLRINIFSSICSLIILFSIVYYMSIEIKEIDFFSNFKDIMILIVFIIIFGIFSSFVSSYFITQRYLKLTISR